MWIQWITFLLLSAVLAEDSDDTSASYKDYYEKVKNYYTACPNFGETKDELKKFCATKYDEVQKSINCLNSFCLNCSGKNCDEKFKDEVCGRIKTINVEGILQELCRNVQATEDMYFTYYECCKPSIYILDECEKLEYYNKEKTQVCHSTEYISCVSTKIDEPCLQNVTAYFQNFLQDTCEVENSSSIESDGTNTVVDVKNIDGNNTHTEKEAVDDNMHTQDMTAKTTIQPNSALRPYAVSIVSLATTLTSVVLLRNFL